MSLRRRAARTHRRPWHARIVRGVLLAAVAALALGGCGAARQTAATPPQPAMPTVAEVRAAFDAALAALRAGDRAAVHAALPALPGSGRRALAALIDTLGGVPWSSLGAQVEAVPGHPGRFQVVVFGGLGGVGPPDRGVAERVLDLRRVNGRLQVSGDATPAGVAGLYLMAYPAPRLLRAPGCEVIYDSLWRPLAQQLAAAFSWARRRVQEAGLHPDHTVPIFLYAARSEITGNLGGARLEPRISCFSIDPRRLSREAWWPADIGVLGPALTGQNSWTPRMLAHELTHAFTMRWFAHTRHEPLLLLEGIAVLVEGDRSYAPLRREFATGNRVLPLLKAIAAKDLWVGKSLALVNLAYLEGGALAGFIVHHWSLDAYRRFAVAVADSDLTPRGIDQASRTSLKVGWSTISSGVRGFAASLP
jgi:hypothetical protein